jgi:hypothetical protein
MNPQRSSLSILCNFIGSASTKLKYSANLALPLWEMKRVVLPRQDQLAWSRNLKLLYSPPRRIRRIIFAVTPSEDSKIRVSSTTMSSSRKKRRLGVTTKV